jgi:hypothetical protein
MLRLALEQLQPAPGRKLGKQGDRGDLGLEIIKGRAEKKAVPAAVCVLLTRFLEQTVGSTALPPGRLTLVTFLPRLRSTCLAALLFASA